MQLPVTSPSFPSLPFFRFFWQALALLALRNPATRAAVLRRSARLCETVGGEPSVAKGLARILLYM